MKNTYEAKKSIAIHAPVEKVWDVLTKPELIKKYMHGAETRSAWRAGSAITWTGEWKGKPYQDKGTILAIDPRRLLKYSHYSPLGGIEDKPENYHTVTFELKEEKGETSLALTQTNNPTPEEAEKMAEKNWGPVLQGLKEVAESSMRL